jgi:hypothetical protein
MAQSFSLTLFHELEESYQGSAYNFNINLASPLVLNDGCGNWMAQCYYAKSPRVLKVLENTPESSGKMNILRISRKMNQREKAAYLKDVTEGKFADGCDPNLYQEPADIMEKGFPFPDDADDVTMGSGEQMMGDDPGIDNVISGLTDAFTEPVDLDKINWDTPPGLPTETAEPETPSTDPAPTDPPSTDPVPTDPAPTPVPIDPKPTNTEPGPKTKPCPEGVQPRAGSLARSANDFSRFFDVGGKKRIQADKSVAKRFVRGIIAIPKEEEGEFDYAFVFYVYLDTTKKGYANLEQLLAAININLNIAGLGQFFQLIVHGDSGKVYLKHNTIPSIPYATWSISAPITKTNDLLFSVLGWGKHVKMGEELSYGEIYNIQEATPLRQKNKTFDLGDRYNFAAMNTCFLLCSDIVEKQICGRTSASEIARFYMNELQPEEYPMVHLPPSVNSAGNVYSRKVINSPRLMTSVPFTFRSLTGTPFALTYPGQFVIAIHFVRE